VNEETRGALALAVAELCADGADLERDGHVKTPSRSHECWTT
jgi:hypothetical protein